MIAAGYKDYNGHGKPNKTNTDSGNSQGKISNSSNGLNSHTAQTKRIGENASKVAKSYGISVGRIPGKTKISGKLKTKCSQISNITLGSDKGNIGRENGKTNKNLFGEVQFNCQNKSGTLFLKWEGGSKAKKGGYGRVKLQN